MSRDLHIAPALPTAEEAAFERAAAAADRRPASVLYLAPSDRPASDVRDRWESIGAPIQLQLSDFDRVVADVLEQKFYTTRARGLSGDQRQRLVEHAVDGLTGATHPLATTADAASSEACSQAEDLLSLLEFAGLTTADAIQADDRLASISSATRDALASLSRSFDQHRGVFNSAGEPQTLRSERYQRVINAPNALAETLDPVDVVVLGPFTYFSPLEADLIDAIAECVDTVHAVLPLAGARTDVALDAADELSGIDRGAQRAWQRYDDLGFTATVTDARTPGASLARQLYRFTPDDAVSRSQLAAAGVDWHTYPTPTHEIRGVAREVRGELADGQAATEIGVVVPGLPERQQELFETFREYGVPARLSDETALAETEVGAAVEHALRLGSDTARVEDVLRVIDNPLVEPAWPDRELAANDVVQLVDRVEVTNLDAVQDLLATRSTAAEVTDAIEWLRSVCRELAAASTANSVSALADALTTLGVIDESATDSWSLAATIDRQSWIDDRETAALQTLNTVATSLEDSASLGDARLDERMPRAMVTATVDAALGSRDGVTLVTPGSVLQHDFEMVVALGLTQAAFPSRPRRLAFTRELNDAHPDFEPTDPAQQARYALALLPTQVETVVYTHPSQTRDGDDTVVADFLAELQRVCIDDFEPTKKDDDSHPPRCREDLQRTAGSALVHATTTGTAGDEPTDIAAALADSDCFAAAPGEPATRLQSGVACGVARQSPATTEYDGWLSAETVDQFEAAAAPLSPSRIDTYAKCGFKFYADYLLDYGSPDEHTREADARTAGQFVHEVLARFFRSLQSREGEPITIEDPDAHHGALYDAVETELEKPYVRHHDSTFHDGWLTRLLAGLTPTHTENEHAGPPGYRGLFVRVLEQIASEHDQVTMRPAFFEAGIGVTHGDDEATTRLTEDPVELVDGVHVRGKIDRVDVVPGTQPTEFVAVDYKTGSSPSIDEVKGGISFQLPLYLRLLDAAADDADEWDPIGAVYYDLDSPSSAGLQKSPLTTTDRAVWHQNGGEPLLRFGTDSLFDSPAAFQEFLYEDTDDRLTQLTESLTSGVFHPTLLDADTANCEHCEYAHVCDVRHHHRHDRLDEHGREAAYIPAYAQPTEDAQ
ncbi:PD-(D/E)XK nuclease family protein [Halobacterium zhouii]|uniref:PD-(D/E)XK nuclease family protein n=1 Tax=Halobacterium zhouii TaxID=2902624 RepID=UPI001E619C77|nr:PD-(D/E)XK nuclease family protein [Halobacterium zhouii]